MQMNRFILKPRFIPAPAGNSGGYQTLHQQVSVHPRACGEQLAVVNMADHRNGSSPRLRGTD